MATLTVGPSGQYATIAAAVTASSSGDTIAVSAGTYTNDFVTITHNLALVAVGGTVTMVATQQPPNGKAIIDEGGSGITVSITGFDISGAVVPDSNGAAIRYEGGSLTLTQVTIHNNQEGLLGAADPAGSILIDHSSFYANGAGDGYSHNIYAGAIASLTVQNSSITASIVGHDIKSRAASTTIVNNTIADTAAGTGSYEIDAPNGGTVVVRGNTIEKGGQAQNPIAISYGEEGNLYANGSVTVDGNTIVNDDTSHATTVLTNATSTVAVLTNNQLYHWTTLVSGPATSSGNTTLTTEPAVACYAAGTLVTTEDGDRPIEALRIGDRLVTRSGVLRPIRWIGRRSYAGTFLASNPDIMPIRFRAFSLGAGRPRRDLRVSPNHAMLLDGVLVPAECLVDGVTILRETGCKRIEYIHLELETHDVIFAEGAAAETFIDDDSRFIFHNAAEHAALYPDSGRPAPRYCAPRITHGERLEAIRRALAARRAPPRPTVGPGLLTGRLDEATPARLRGWACDAAAPDRPVRLQVTDNGVTIAEITADRDRPDLAKTGIGPAHGFELLIPGGFPPSIPHVIHVRRAADQKDLPNSPWRIESSAPPMDTTAVATTHRGTGHLDSASRDRIHGWAHDGEAPVALQVLDNGRVIGRVLANRHRADLARAGLGDGRHAFEFEVLGGLSPLARHVIQVRRERDGAELTGSPAIIEPVSTFDSAFEQAVSQALADIDPAEERRVLSFMLHQADRLMQREAKADAARAAERRRSLLAGLEAGAAPRRALVIDERMPVPGRDAGSQSILSHIRALRRLGYDVSLVAADELDIDGLDVPGVTLCGAPFHSSVEALLRRQANRFDLVYLHRVGAASRYLSLARQHNPGCRIVYSLADLHHLRIERQAESEGRPELLDLAHRLRLAEYTAALSADAVITHSHHEAALLSQALPAANVHVVPWDIPCPTPRPPFARRAGVAFIGHYTHAPNRDAAHWLVEEVMPRVWQLDPSISCLLVGTAMPDTIRNLARPGVTVVGAVQDLARDIFDRIRLTVAPLRFGAGLKGKVIESFAAGLPCAMTDIAAEGIALNAALRTLVANDPAALAATIHRLHTNNRDNRAATIAAKALIGRCFTPDTVTTALGGAITRPRERRRQV